jgi:hypothetical protein
MKTRAAVTLGKSSMTSFGCANRRSPMRDLRSDWKRWSHAERVSAIALVATFICGSLIFGLLTGGSPGRRVSLLATTPIEWSGTHVSHGMRL